MAKAEVVMTEVATRNIYLERYSESRLGSKHRYGTLNLTGEKKLKPIIDWLNKRDSQEWKFAFFKLIVFVCMVITAIGIVIWQYHERPLMATLLSVVCFCGICAFFYVFLKYQEASLRTECSNLFYAWFSKDPQLFAAFYAAGGGSAEVFCAFHCPKESFYDSYLPKPTEEHKTFSAPSYRPPNDKS